MGTVGESRRGKFELPKNIRQIGQVQGNKRVYVEDYVMTFARNQGKRLEKTYGIAVLLGKNVREKEYSYTFVSGAVCVEDLNLDEKVIFSNEVWSEIYTSIKQYFMELEIVGWMLFRKEFTNDLDEKIKQIHQDNFKGQNKILFLYDLLEYEEAVYVHDGTILKKQAGYYIYYEKNEPMQNYMIERNGNRSQEEGYEEETIKNIRKVIADKKPTEEKKTVTLMYAASTVLTAVVLIIGATMLNSYDKMNNMEEVLSTLSDNVNSMDNEVKIETAEVSITEMTTSPISQTTSETKTIIESVETTSETITETIQEQTETVSQTDNSEETEAQTEAEEADAKIQYYIVKKGDTLVSISKEKYDTIQYVNKIKELNELDDENLIYEGQKLRLP